VRKFNFDESILKDVILKSTENDDIKECAIKILQVRLDKIKTYRELEDKFGTDTFYESLILLDKLDIWEYIKLI
jgi:hypothetical protein